MGVSTDVFRPSHVEVLCGSFREIDGTYSTSYTL